MQTIRDEALIRPDGDNETINVINMMDTNFTTVWRICLPSVGPAVARKQKINMLVESNVVQIRFDCTYIDLSFSAFTPCFNTQINADVSLCLKDTNLIEILSLLTLKYILLVVGVAVI